MVEVLLVVIGVVLVGLPLLALGLDRVVPPPRNRPAPTVRDPLEVVRHEHGLRWQDLEEVSAAVRGGRAVAPPELRPAARRLAELVLAPPFPTFLGRPVSDYPRWQQVAVRVVFVVLLLVYAGAVVGRGRVDVLSGYAVVLVVTAACGQLARRRRRGRAREALAANT